MKIRLSFIPMVVLAACATSLYAANCKCGDACKCTDCKCGATCACPSEAKPAAPRGPSLAKRFEAADANKDGKLSKIEFGVLRELDKENTRQRIEARGEVFDSDRFDIRTLEIFMKLDTNSDGFVSKEEFTKGYSAAASQKPPVKEEIKKAEPPKKEAPAKKAPPPKKAPARKK